jgi:hypothetical protein
LNQFLGPVLKSESIHTQRHPTHFSPQNSIFVDFIGPETQAGVVKFNRGADVARGSVGLR